MSTSEALMTDPTTPEGAAYWQERHDYEEALERMDEPEQASLDLITDHAFQPGRPPQASGECSWDNGDWNAMVCGYSRAEHAAGPSPDHDRDDQVAP